MLGDRDCGDLRDWWYGDEQKRRDEDSTQITSSSLSVLATPDRQRLPEAASTDIIDHPLFLDLTICRPYSWTPQSSQPDHQLPQHRLEQSPQCLKPTNVNGIHTLLPCCGHYTATDKSKSQNNSRLDDLAGKVSALRGVTIDIYDNARDQTVIDSSTNAFSNFSNTLQGSAGRLTRMAQQGNKVAILKLAGILIAIVLVLYWIGGWVFGGSKAA
ncbi:hypothetical protein E4T52_08301 [Aureobasidium sp. EXF-3400]|nr:hypothetical protein E4T52_08301 [Aureobasidium sp. EXF-3400]